MVCTQGASKPVNHISLTMTIFNGSSSFLNLPFIASVASLVLKCGFQASGSLEIFPVITTATSGQPSKAVNALYIFTQLRLLIQTTMAFPASVLVLLV